MTVFYIGICNKSGWIIHLIWLDLVIVIVYKQLVGRCWTYGCKRKFSINFYLSVYFYVKMIEIINRYIIRNDYEK